MAKRCSNLKLNWLPGRTDLLLPLVSVVTPSIYLIQTFTYRDAFDLQHHIALLSILHRSALFSVRRPSGSTYGGGGGYVTNVQSYTEECREELQCSGDDWSWERLVTKEAKPWAPEDVQRWRRWHVCDLVAVVLLLLIGCYRRLPFDLLGSRDQKKRPKSFSENSAKAGNHFHGVSRCWVSRFMRVRGYGSRLRSYCPTCDQTKRFPGTYA